MNSRFLRIVCVCTCLVATTGLAALAQMRPPGGGPGGPVPGSYGPLGPGGRVGPNSAHLPSSGLGRTNHAASSGLQFGPSGRWWDDRSVVQSIGLRNQQQREMDAIFNANKPSILASYKNFLSEQSKLEKMNSDPHVDKTRLFAAIDAVSQARASLQKATSQMLLEIRQKMDPDQIVKLGKIQ